MFAAGDAEGIRRAVRDHRDQWTTAAADLIDAGPPRYLVEYERYRDVYIWLFGIVDTDGDLPRIANGYPPQYQDRSSNPDDGIDASASEHCG